MHIFFKVDKKKRKRGLHVKRRYKAKHHLREWLWPSIGGRALLRFMEISLKRSRGEVHAIAFGFAAGAFASFTPYIGFHSIIAISLCFLFKGSYITGLIGTLVGNPWTFPFIWLWTFNLGNFILEVKNPRALPESFELSTVSNELSMYFEHFLFPMTIGGIPTGILVALAIYWLIYLNVFSYRKLRNRFLADRRKHWGISDFIRNKKDAFRKSSIKKAKKSAKSSAKKTAQKAVRKSANKMAKKIVRKNKKQGKHS